MNIYDAVVVGAGPAGSTAAYILSTKGYRVLLVDKEKFPRRKLCGGALTDKTMRLLGKTFNESPASLSKNKIIDFNSNHFEIRHKTGVLIKKDCAHTFYFIDRFVYDDFLLQKAAQAGADTALGEKITTIKNMRQAVSYREEESGEAEYGGAASLWRSNNAAESELVTESGRTIRTKYVVAADGANSIIRRQLAREHKIAASGWRRGLAYAVEASIDREEKFSAITYPVLIFGYIRYGYAWIFPNRQRLIVGMGGLERKNSRDLSHRFMAFLDDFGINTSVKFRGHPLPFGNFLKRPAWGNILLAGDAAGLVDPMLGEGIYQAHKSGELAARAIIDTIKAGACPQPKRGSEITPSFLENLRKKTRLSKISSIKNNSNVEDNYISLLKTHLLPEFVFARRARWFVYNPLNHFLQYRSARWVEKYFDKLAELIHGFRTYKGFRRKML